MSLYKSWKHLVVKTLMLFVVSRALKIRHLWLLKLVIFLHGDLKHIAIADSYHMLWLS
jgi:hypothetical protein